MTGPINFNPLHYIEACWIVFFQTHIFCSTIAFVAQTKWETRALLASVTFAIAFVRISINMSLSRTRDDAAIACIDIQGLSRDSSRIGQKGHSVGHFGGSHGPTQGSRRSYMFQQVVKVGNALGTGCGNGTSRNAIHV